MQHEPVNKVNSDEIDIVADAEEQPTTPKDLQQAVRYADEMRVIEAKLEAMKNEAANLKARFDKIQLELLPDLLLAIGMKKFFLTDGFILEVKPFLRGSIPTLNQIATAEESERVVLEDRRDKALTWLRENNAESIIKNQVIALFGKGQSDDAKALFDKLAADGFAVKKEEEINFQTLNSYLKQAVASGKTVPAEPFGLFVGNKAELKKEKGK